ncbi:MAG: SAVED domain-containing protein [Candidatus Levyibacteriota bacterium]
MMSNNFIFPRLAHDDTFEDIVCDILANDFRNPNIQRYGRKGQKQKGIDIVGIAGKNYVMEELIGAQCKNHVTKISDKKLMQEVLDELEKFEKNNLPIDRFLFITSAGNSPVVKDFVIDLSRQRVKEGKCPVDILFWDYITDKLGEYKEILYKYFTYVLPTQKTENLIIPDLYQATRKTLSFTANELTVQNADTLRAKLFDITVKNMSGLEKADAYNLYIGLSTKPDVSFSGFVDLDINCSALFGDESLLPDKFVSLKAVLKSLIAVISDPAFSKKLVLYTDIEIGFAFLLGRILRKFRYDVTVIFKQQAWSTNQDLLPYVPPDISETLPVIEDVSNNQGVFIFNAVNRSSAEDDVLAHIGSQKEKPRIMVSYKIATTQISSSAHALSLAKSIVAKIHMLESWKIKDIHLFLLVPKPLALLIGYILNTLNSNIHLYFMDGTRARYLVSGTINNNTF